MNRLRVAAAVALAITASLIAAPAQAAPPPRMVVIGDSLAYQMCGGDSQAIPTREVSAADIGCFGWSGVTSGGMIQQINMPGWVDPLNNIRANQRFDLRQAVWSADVLVVSLGSNNAMRRQDPQWLAWDLGNMVRLAKPSARIIWYDVGMRKDAVAPIMDRAQFASAVAQDEILWRESRKYPNVTVLPWGGAVGYDKSLLKDDGLHLSQKGWQTRWSLIKDLL